jgi:hypothetical protein
MLRVIRKAWHRFHRDERGQDMLEWVIGLPLFLLLCGAIAFYAWLWWNQTTAAIAIHDGTYLAAQRGGSFGAGMGRTRQLLGAALGAASGDYQVSIAEDPATRSMIGHIENNGVLRIPFLGSMPLRIRAASWQRLEQFYGGPPQGWW